MLLLAGCSDPRSAPVENYLNALQKGDADQLSSTLSAPAYTMFMNFVPMLDCPLTKKSAPLNTEGEKCACIREYYNDMEYSIKQIKIGSTPEEAIITVEERIHGSTQKKEYNVELIDGTWKLL